MAVDKYTIRLPVSAWGFSPDKVSDQLIIDGYSYARERLMKRYFFTIIQEYFYLSRNIKVEYIFRAL